MNQHMTNHVYKSTAQTFTHGPILLNKSGLKVVKYYWSVDTRAIFDTDRLVVTWLSEYLLFSFHCFDGEDDFSLVGVVEVFVADLLGDHSALDLGAPLSDQAEPNSHQRVDVSGLKETRKEPMQNVGNW